MEELTSDENSTETSEEEEEVVNLDAVVDFVPRPYQQELFECALEKNSILVLGTGSGKTFISIMLIKELGDTIRGSLLTGAKRTIFIVNTVPLVHQQSEAIKCHTPYAVGKYEGSMGVDYWTDEKWAEEIDKYEVLVMVAEIFKNLLHHNRLSLEQVNLLIIDECHHATGDHPMRAIMKEYSELKDRRPDILLPRVMGLTACVIHKKCKPTQVPSLMKCLEATMDSALVTSRFQALVKLHTTRPREMLVDFTKDPVTPSFERLHNSFEEIRETMFKFINTTLINFLKEMFICKVKKFIDRLLKGLEHTVSELGDYILGSAIALECDYLRNCETDSREEQLICHQLASELEKKCLPIICNEDDDPLLHISAKVKRLYEILSLCNSQTNQVKILVFVERRNTAKLLHSLLLKVKDMDSTLQYLVPESIVGGTTNMKNDLKVQQEIKKQKEIMNRFRKGDCNIIFSTSVLEEGVDVQKCNTVIRFDKPKNFRAYIQSLGRARAVPSKYVLLSEKDETSVILEDISCYKAINQRLINLCHDRPLPSHEDVIGSFIDSEEVEPPYAPVGFPGPKITFGSAVSLINKYCGVLPHDKFTDLSVTVTIRKSGELVKMAISLPINAPLKTPVWGSLKSNQDYAKKSAALAMCKKLHAMGQLDRNLFPRKLKDSIDIIKRVPVQFDEAEKGQPQPGTRKRRQIYDRQLCGNFQGDSDKHLYLHVIEFDDSANVLSVSPKKLGILSGNWMECCPFSLYCSKLGEIRVRVSFIGKQNMSFVLFQQVKHFHMISYQLLLNINQGITLFNPEFKQHSVFTVPLTNENKIDFAYLKDMESFTSLADWAHSHSPDLNNSMNFDKYRDAVIIPRYRDPEYYFVEEVRSDMNPLSVFPEHKKTYSNYKEYYRDAYRQDIKNNNQPLLKCRHFPKELNKVKVKPGKRSSKDREDTHPLFVPELCIIIPFPASLWWQITIFPSVLHRLNGLLLEKELYFDIGHLPSAAEEVNFILKTLDYLWCETEVSTLNPSLTRNLVVTLHDKSETVVYPGMILQALTPMSVGDNFNLERLEVLGDSFLKFSIGIFLFCNEKDYHEGLLTAERSQLVSNKMLYSLAKKKNIGKYYQGFVLNRLTLAPYGFHYISDIEEILRSENVDPMHWMDYFSTEDEKPEPCEYSYHPWEEQLVPDKCVADCCEALIGVYLLTGGERAAKHFMIWLGYEFLQENSKPPETAILLNRATPSDIRALSRKFCLDKLERIIGYQFKEKSFLIQAVSHPSYQQNKITDCYQRLEFLGDAVLDYLITGFIFAEFNKYDPGQLTDLRSHYVKNETLARAAVRLKLDTFLQHMSPKLMTGITNFKELLEEGEKEFTMEDDTTEAEDVEVPKALGDLVEAIIGAVYIDSRQSLQKCWEVIQILLGEEFQATQNETPINHIRALYEKCSSVELQPFPPTEDEPAKCIVKMEGFPEYTGTGKNQRTAKQAAAKLALYHIRQAEIAKVSEVPAGDLDLIYF